MFCVFCKYDLAVSLSFCLSIYLSPFSFSRVVLCAAHSRIVFIHRLEVFNSARIHKVYTFSMSEQETENKKQARHESERQIDKKHKTDISYLPYFCCVRRNMDIQMICVL